jgi:hypothetical protein
MTTDKQCRRSTSDHVKLKQEARSDRQKLNFNVEESFVICLQCGMGISLK